MFPLRLVTVRLAGRPYASPAKTAEVPPILPGTASSGPFSG